MTRSFARSRTGAAILRSICRLLTWVSHGPWTIGADLGQSKRREPRKQSAMANGTKEDIPTRMLCTTVCGDGLRCAPTWPKCVNPWRCVSDWRGCFWRHWHDIPPDKMRVVNDD